MMIKVDYILKEILKGEMLKESKKTKSPYFVPNTDEGKLITLFSFNYHKFFMIKNK